MKVNLLGTKVGMTQVYDEDNRLVPVTVIQAGPCPITQIKTVETDGYNAIQFGFKPQKKQRLSAAEQGHLAKAGVEPVANLQELRVEDTAEYNVGDVFSVENFEEGQKIDVIATTKGRGFQGVVKRWGFSGGKNSHGHMMHRRGGSYGQCQWPGEIDKGKKMPGHMGNKSRTTQNLKIVKILKEKNLILVKGSFGGSKGSLITVRPSVKRR